jgi:DNA-binding response OmpR family regulator
MHDGRGKRALILDDDLATTHLQRRSLELAGFDVACAHDVRAALAAMQNAAFDVLVLDYNLADCTGFDVLADIDRLGMSLPVVMVSGWDDEAITVRARHAGVRQFVHKSGEYLAKLPHVVAAAMAQVA